MELPLAITLESDGFLYRALLEIETGTNSWEAELYLEFRSDIDEDILLIGRDALWALGLDFSLSMRGQEFALTNFIAQE